MTESYEDQLSRVRLMASGDNQWDLSPNDQAALKAVLESHHEMKGLLSTAVDAFDNRQFKSGDWHQIQLHRAWFDAARKLTEELKEAAGRIER